VKIATFYMSESRSLKRNDHDRTYSCPEYGTRCQPL
jgi:hypothetical protein